MTGSLFLPAELALAYPPASGNLVPDQIACGIRENDPALITETPCCPDHDKDSTVFVSQYPVAAGHELRIPRAGDGRTGDES